MKKLLFVFLIIAMPKFPAFGQPEKKPNPVLYYEGLLGHSWGESGGFSLGAQLNYQTNKNLFTLRYNATIRMHWEISNPFVPIPIARAVSDLEEYSFLYGFRFIHDGISFSPSVGLSHNVLSRYLKDENLQNYTEISKYLGVPYEINVKFFKNQKQRYRLYHIIPVGKPTAFGKSIGFKIFGNFSKTRYGGFGVTYGYGYHKVYNGTKL
jgi:hypothetical protein